MGQIIKYMWTCTRQPETAPLLVCVGAAGTRASEGRTTLQRATCLDSRCRGVCHFTRVLTRVHARVCNAGEKVHASRRGYGAARCSLRVGRMSELRWERAAAGQRMSIGWQGRTRRRRWAIRLSQS